MAGPGVGDIRRVVLGRGEAKRVVVALLESGEPMPILVKHSGGVAPTLVGAYGGGMGKRYAEQSDDAMRRIAARQAAARRPIVGRKTRGGGKSARQEEAEAAGFVGVGDNPALRGGGQPNMFGDPNTRQLTLPNAGGSRMWRQPDRKSPEEIAFERRLKLDEDRANRITDRQLEVQKNAQAEAARVAKEKESARLREINPLFGVDMKGWGEKKRAAFRALRSKVDEARKIVEPEELPEFNRQVQNKLMDIQAMEDEPPETIPLGDRAVAEGETVEYGDDLLQAVRSSSTGKLEFKSIAKKTAPKETPAEKRDAVATQKREDRRSKLVAETYKNMTTFDDNNNPTPPDPEAVAKAVADIEAIEAKLAGVEDEAQPENDPVTFVGTSGGVIRDPESIPAGETVWDQETGQAYIRKKDGKFYPLRDDTSPGNSMNAPLSAPSTGGGVRDTLARPDDMPEDWGIARIATDAQFEALPSGSEFIGPDGLKRRKP
jgi:hypothetical protein